MTNKIPSSSFSKKTNSKTRPKPKTIDTIVTYLEMAAQPIRREHPPVNLQIALTHLEKPPVHFYRYLYEEVGREYHWIDRQRLTDKQLLEKIHHPEVILYAAYVHGAPAGFYEIDIINPEQAWLAYFGIMPDFQGRGIGKWLLSEAVTTAWEQKPKSVRVETCTLDHPRALSLYQKIGFRPYERQDKTMELLDEA